MDLTKEMKVVLGTKQVEDKMRVTLKLSDEVKKAVDMCCVKRLKPAEYMINGETRKRYKILEALALISNENEYVLFDIDFISKGYADFPLNINLNSVANHIKTSVARCCVIYNKFHTRMTRKKIKEVKKNDN